MKLIKSLGNRLSHSPSGMISSMTCSYGSSACDYADEGGFFAGEVSNSSLIKMMGETTYWKELFMKVVTTFICVYPISSIVLSTKKYLRTNLI
jgi:hypothetical protein